MKAKRLALHSQGTDASAVPEASTTQQDEVYARLHRMLTQGRFAPGERLKIRQMAVELNTGQMPVRAALLRLASEGALSNHPHAGVAVPKLSLAEFDDLLRLRLLLEGEAAARGALALSAADIANLQELCERMEVALKAGQFADYLAANDDFHVHLYRASGSPLLFGLIDTLWLKAGPISNQLFDDPTAALSLNQGHQDLMAALHRRDADAARQAIERDLFVAGQLLRRAIAAPPPHTAPKAGRQDRQKKQSAVL
jgi:DNA-binding GntR family transcriptional regulator